MSTLSVTNTFASGNIIRASEHNTNFQDVVTWANGNITDENFDSFTGPVVWSVTTNSLAISSTNTGTEGSASFSHNGTLAASKSILKITSNAAQTNGTAGIEVNMSSASSNIPAVKITDAGAGPSAALEVVSTTKGTIPFPKMTTAQRNAITSPVEGTFIYNTSLKRAEFYNGSYWIAASGQSGTQVDWLSDTARTDMLPADGTAVSRTTYAYLFSVLGTTYGAGDGSTTFNLPDSRRRVTVGKGGTGTATLANSVGSTGGAETHSLTASENGQHAHNITDPGHTHTAGGGGQFVTSAAGVSPYAGTNNITLANTTNSSTTGITVSNNGSGDAHNNMQPSLVVTKAVVI